MVATKPHVIKAVLLTALTVHCPYNLPHFLPGLPGGVCVSLHGAGGDLRLHSLSLFL